MKIGKREYVLSPRRAVEVLDLAAAVGGIKEEDSNPLLIAAQVVADSLKATGLNLGRVRGFRYRRFTGKGGVRFLTHELSQPAIWKAYLEVLEIEEAEKKRLMGEVERSSAVKSAAG
jgi:hypothetical protein